MGVVTGTPYLITNRVNKLQFEAWPYAADTVGFMQLWITDNRDGADLIQLNGVRLRAHELTAQQIEKNVGSFGTWVVQSHDIDCKFFIVPASKFETDWEVLTVDYKGLGDRHSLASHTGNIHLLQGCEFCKRCLCHDALSLQADCISAPDLAKNIKGQSVSWTEVDEAQNLFGRDRVNIGTANFEAVVTFRKEVFELARKCTSVDDSFEELIDNCVMLEDYLLTGDLLVEEDVTKRD